MRRLLLACVLGFGLCGAAQASSSIHCRSDDGASLVLGLGSVPILAVISATIETPDVTLKMDDKSIGVAHGFADAESIKVDFTDEIVNEIVARLRLFRIYEQSDFAMAGTLQVVGYGAYALICDEP